MLLNNMHHAGLLNSQAGKYWSISLAAGLASCFLFLSPWGRKGNRVVCSLGLVCLLTFALGCGGGSSASPSSGGSGARAGGGASPPFSTITPSTSKPKIAPKKPFLIPPTLNYSQPPTGDDSLFNFCSP